MKKSSLFAVQLCLFMSYSQTPAGKNTFSFLGMPINARVAGLGGELVSQYNDDANLIKYNPASANYSMNKQYSLTFMNYYANTYLTNNNFTYAKDSTSYVWHGNISYIDYGQMDRYDDGGNLIGAFRARDFSAQVASAKKINNYSMGASLGFSGSNIAGYNANSIFLDLGGMFIHPKKPLTIGMAIKNIGVNFNNYRKNNHESLPIDIQAGVTIKPEHMPLRFNITGHHLYRYDISYYDPKSTLYQSTDETNKKPNFLLKAVRHFNIGIEAILSKGFNIRAGYNFMRRQDLKFQSGTSGWSGFSIGPMIRIKRFSLEYTQIFYHVSGSKGMFTMNVKL